MASEFTEKVVSLLLAVPAGKVTTYGSLAVRAGNPHGARQVVRILNSLSVSRGLPWHRVVNREGRIAIVDEGGRDLQKKLLEADGVPVKDGRVDLAYFI
jgi:methylated-DNA-protein-cysteine methyltransferase-like protein